MKFSADWSKKKLNRLKICLRQIGQKKNVLILITKKKYKEPKVLKHSCLPILKIQDLKDQLSHPIILAPQSVVPGLAVLTSPGRVSEMQNLRPHLKPAESKFAL